jgi:hypothetical protein
MKPYGLPYDDIPGITDYADLKDAHNARLMGEAMQERMGRGDVPLNLAVTSLITNAYLLTSEAKYREWVLEYTDVWLERARQNGGLVPDNVGLSGKVGEYLDGRWYGGLYGWTWPHEFHSVGEAVLIAAENAYLLTKNELYLDFARWQLDKLLEQGKPTDITKLEMSLGSKWRNQL